MSALINLWMLLWLQASLGCTATATSWPDGEYAIPMSVFGCPDAGATKWAFGYMNISFKQVTELYATSLGKIHWDGARIDLLGPYGPFSFQLNFCVKESEEKKISENLTVTWPDGRYYIYGRGTDCPKGFNSSFIEYDLPQIMHVNKDGVLPEINVSVLDKSAKIGFLLCKKLSDDVHNESNSTSPFLLLATNEDSSVEKQTGVDIKKLYFETTDEFVGRRSVDLAADGDRWWLNLQGPKVAVKTLFSKGNSYIDLDYSSDEAPWVLYDLGHSAVLIGIRIRLRNIHDAGVDNHFIDTVYVSNMKWSFLYNGAENCILHLLLEDFSFYLNCINNVSGRFVAIRFGQASEGSKWQPLISSIESVYFYTLQDTIRCNRPLGLRDGSIEDFQISSSSTLTGYKVVNARPDKPSGWCADPSDPSPHLQIDLFIPTSVEGLELTTWEEKSHISGAVYSKVIRGMGTYSFLIEYGSSLPELQTYSQMFRIDKSQPFGIFQTLLFASPLKTRFMRILPVDKISEEGSLCLKLELIGCPVVDSYSLDCTNNSTKYWYIDHSLFSSQDEGSMNTMLQVDIATNCWQKCMENDTNVIGCLHDKDTKTCELYQSSKSFSYGVIQFKENKQDALLRVCTAGPSDYVSSLHKYSVISITQPGPLISHGYPFHYKLDMNFFWNIFFDGAYINVVFSNISFNVFQTGDGGNNVCEDRVTVETGVSSNSSWTYDGWLAEKSGIRTLQEINWTFNDNQVVYKMDLTAALVQFRTCFQDKPILQEGRGFRMYTYGSAMPTCRSSNNPSYKSHCKWKEANLVSASFMGFLSEGNDYERWDIIATDSNYIILTITDFDVGCESGTVFKITNDDYYRLQRGSYCNRDKPVGDVISMQDILRVDFYLDLNLVPEGFSAKYVSVRKNAYIADFPVILNPAGDIFEFHTNKVCSQELKKCFVIVSLMNVFTAMPLHEKGWNFVNTEFCNKKGWSMVNLHSKSEIDFVGYHIQERMKKRRQKARLDRLNLREYSLFGTAYIGLRRSDSTNNNLNYSWAGSGPMTVTAWAPGHPLNFGNSNCTRMVARLLSKEYTWESIPCFIRAAEYAVCESFMVTPKDSDTDTGSSPGDNSENMPFVEKAIFFECSETQVISFLGRCDGNADCPDGKDEDDCDTVQTNNTLEYFRCEDGQFVYRSVVCDHHYDCQDRSDENCNFPRCGDNQFQCDNYLCIDQRQVCDGKSNCPGGEDEKVVCHRSLTARCDPEVSFSCDTCIPLAYRCDSVPDCSQKEDEEDCEEPESCQEWWNAGYRNSGRYIIGDKDIECNFSMIFTKGQIITKYHGIDFLDSQGKRNYVSFQLNTNYTWSELFNGSRNCSQSFDQLCQPWLEELYENDKSGTGGQFSLCRCVRYTTWFDQEDGYLEYCDGPTNGKPSPGEFHYIINKSVIQQSSFVTSMHTKDGSRINLKHLRIKINPIICYSDFQTQPPDIACGNGVTAPLETKCLYLRDKHEHLIGCRNLAHLQNCESFVCPDGFFKCENSFCIANHYVCDGTVHCLNKEDETNCGLMTYRCLQSDKELKMEYLCDEFEHCPLKDDERFCSFRCPEMCFCSALTADCRNTGNDNSTLKHMLFSDMLRSLDISTNYQLFPYLGAAVHKLLYLSYLNMSKCEIIDIPVGFFSQMRNLLLIDLSFNRLQVFKSNTFSSQSKLKILFLHGNSDIHLIEPKAFGGLNSLTHIEITHAVINKIDANAFSSLQLVSLDLSHNQIETIENYAFQASTVDRVYMHATSIGNFGEFLFYGLKINYTLQTSAYRFCCVRPSCFPEDKCFPKKDEFSSCSDLLRNDVLAFLMWIIAIVSLAGNAMSLLYRSLGDRGKQKLGYGIFVSNLAVADFIMGVYLTLIAVADTVFRGVYIYKDEYWRKSAWCSFAGVLSTLSSEASVFFVCLITIDRFLVVKYPFGQFRFSKKLAHMVALGSWIMASMVSLIPVLFTSYFKGSFYSKSAVCLALPLTRDRPPGWAYSISIFIVFNFLTFVLIAVGQVMIFREIRLSKSKISKIRGRNNDLRIARNLLLVVATDFLCWVPIGIVGLLALTNHVIEGEIYAWIAVIVLPINSALNPCLYTLSAILASRHTPSHDDEQSKASIQSRSKEQLITTVLAKAEKSRDLDQLLTLWKSSCFLKPMTDISYKLVPLSEVCKAGGLTSQQCVQITVGLAKCLHALHSRGLIQSNLSIKHVFIREKTSGGFGVVLSLHPKRASTDTEKYQNMGVFGRTLTSVLRSRVKQSMAETRL